jgi:hypothetical protein
MYIQCAHMRIAMGAKGEREFHKIFVRDYALAQSFLLIVVAFDMFIVYLLR